MKMKRFIKSFLFVLITISIVSCSKEAPIDNQGEVVFKFDGTIDSKSELFEAGENNYYLSTSYQDSGPNEVLLMRGEFLDKTNPTDNYLRFEFYGYDSTTNTGILQKVFDRINYNSYSSDSTLQTVGATTLKFNAIYGTGAVINWDFGDGSTATGDSVSHTFAQNATDANVMMSAFYSAVSCGDSVSNLINLIDPVNSQVQFNVSALNLNLDSFQFNATQGFNSYSWDFGNQTNQQGINSIVQVAYSDSLRKIITLNATKSLTSSTWKAVVTPNNVPCFAAYVYSVTSLPVTTNSVRVPYKTCVITYKKDGTIYRSYKNNLLDQSARNVFSLNTAQVYDNNPAGDPTVRLTGSVNTFLYNENNSNDSIPIKGSTVSIAVAHP